MWNLILQLLILNRLLYNVLNANNVDGALNEYVLWNKH